MFDYKRIPLREGGIDVVVEELATRMAKEEDGVTCYDRAGYHVGGAEFDVQDRSERKGVNIKTFPTFEKKLDSCECLFLFAASCSAFGRYNMVYIHAEDPASFCWIPHFMGKSCCYGT